jgi:hypothetical protein
MLRLTRKFLTFWEKPRLSAEVRRANQLLKPSERYTLREIERRVKENLRDYAFDKPIVVNLQRLLGREAVMGKATMCLLVALCSLAAFGQNQPQWKVVQSVILTHQTAVIPQTTIFTPNRPGLYRLSGYMTASAKQAPKGDGFYFTFACSDLSDGFCGASMHSEYLVDQPALVNPQISYLFSPHPGTPVSYLVTAPPPTVEYTLAFTIEQLQ